MRHYLPDDLNDDPDVKKGHYRLCIEPLNLLPSISSPPPPASSGLMITRSQQKL